MLPMLKGPLGSIIGKVLQLAFGVALMFGLAAAARAAIPADPQRAGWQIIRPPSEVSALAIQGDILWAGGRDGLFAVNRASGQLSPLPDYPGIRYVSDLAVDRLGSLWIAHRAGLTRYLEGKWLTYDLEVPLTGATTALVEDRNGDLWVGSEQGAAKYDGRAWHSFTPRNGLAFPEVSSIFQDRSGTMWFGSASPSRGGLMAYDGLAWKAFTTEQGLAHNSVNSIIEDRSGALWVGTGFANLGGASRFKQGSWNSLTRSDGLAGEKVRSVYEDKAGRLWFGSEYDGIALLDGQTWRVLTPNDGLSGWEVKEMVQDPDGAFWLATEDGLTRLAKLD